MFFFFIMYHRSQPVVYINDPATVVILNYTLTLATPTTVEADRVVCFNDPICMERNGQDRGPIIGRRVWNIVSSTLPVWTNYMQYVDVGVLNALNGSSISSLNAYIKMLGRTWRSAATVQCPIGYSPYWDETGAQVCRYQSDVVLTTGFFNMIMTGIVLLVVIFCVVLVIVFTTFVYLRIMEKFLKDTGATL